MRVTNSVQNRNKFKVSHGNLTTNTYKTCSVRVLLCFIDPRVRKIRNEGSSCLGIFSRTLRFYFVANSPGSPLPHLLGNQAHGRDNKASKTTSRTMLQRAPNTQHAARSTACCWIYLSLRDNLLTPLLTNSTLLQPTFQSPCCCDDVKDVY